jgi:hypothetical protein
MGPSQPSTWLRARRVALLCAALALIAVAAFVLARLSAPRAGVGVGVSSNAPLPPLPARHGVGSGTFRRSPPYASPPPTVGLATATAAAAAAAAAQATKSARASATAQAAAQAAPRRVLWWVSTDSNRTGPFTITGHAWKVELRCSGAPNATDVIVRAFYDYGGFGPDQWARPPDQLEYRCPAGLSGDMNLGTTSATFHGTGRFYLSVDSGTNTNVVWEVTVTDMP